jgi:Fur family transcriptional regulator, ferric uptake regulator
MYSKQEHKIKDTLKALGIGCTKCRLKVYLLFHTKKKALPISFINKYFDGILDRISVYRALKLFLQKGILYKLPNINGDIAYALSNTSSINTSNKLVQTSYFLCSHCEKSTLLEILPTKHFKLPTHITVSKSYFCFEGICKQCEKLNKIKQNKVKV